MSIFPIFRETGVFPAPPTTIFPIQIIGKEDGDGELITFLILVPRRNNNDNGYKELDIKVSFFLYQNLGAFNIA